jgi:transposase
MKPQQQYVGLDVSLEQTSICVVDDAGATIWRGKCLSTPESIHTVVAKHAPEAVRIGLESGQLSTWLFHELKARGLPVICIDARHAKAALSLQINKTDANDAHGIAQIVRVGWYREVAVKSMDSHAIRSVLVARAQLVTQKVKLTNCIRGLLKTFGIVLGGGKGRRFEVMVRERIVENPMLTTIIEPMLVVLLTVREQLGVFERLVRRRARADHDVRRLMTVPGVGAVIALAYTTTIEDPTRFKRSSSVAAYLGLTPRRYQSGEMDRTGHISRCGDAMLRTYLYEAANVMLRRSTRPSHISIWGRALSERIGARKALVAVARKLALLLHSMWRHRMEFRFEQAAA